MWMQGLTTKEPDDTMIEVAIAAVEAVFDWRAYLDENFPGWEKKEEQAENDPWDSFGRRKRKAGKSRCS